MPPFAPDEMAQHLCDMTTRLVDGTYEVQMLFPSASAKDVETLPSGMRDTPANGRRRRGGA